MAIKLNSPGWIARCPRCRFEVDLKSLGWIRKGAVSWGKRRCIHCPDCNQSRSMQTIHVDENGNPDQTLGRVLEMVVVMQAMIATTVLAIQMVFGVVPLPW